MAVRAYVEAAVEAAEDSGWAVRGERGVDELGLASVGMVATVSERLAFGGK